MTIKKPVSILSKRLTSRLICLLASAIPLLLPTTTQADTLRDKNGEIMRGTRMVLGKPFRPGSDMPTVSNTLDLQEWLYLKKLGFNTIRVVWVDPYVKDDPKWNFAGAWWEVDEVIPYLDAAVENATQSGMNIIIDYHNVGEYVAQSDFMDAQADFGEMAEFWQKVAPRYADNDLVYYELNNEQSWFSTDYYKEEFINTMQAVYTQVRTDAPKRTIIMFSFNNIAQPMKDIADTYSFIDWDYTAVGYHMYAWITNTEENEIASLEKLLASDYPTICTEWGYEYGADYYKAYLGYPINAQALEHYSQSWIDWRDWKVSSLSQITDVLIPDAKAKGYYWVSSASSASSSSVGTSESSQSSSEEVSSASTSSGASSVSYSSEPSRSSSSNSSSSAPTVCTTGCNWYGTMYPLCIHEQTGWHWVKDHSCIGAQTCENQWGNGGLGAICYPTTDTTANKSSLSSSSTATLNCDTVDIHQWDNGYAGSFSVTNNNSTVDNWRIQIEFPQVVQITNTWGALIQKTERTETGTVIVLNNASWNGHLESGDRLIFGVQGSTDAQLGTIQCTQYLE